MDAVEKAKSGHPGAPMGLADIAEVLWRDVLAHNPENPDWWNRDRFVLSNGHGSMLLYAVLHLTGYDVSIEDIENFRQLNAKTAGHPEFGECPGVETTTGPLGQGFANAVGLALAESLLEREFNRDGFPIVDHRTFVVVGDGCLMEGISHEAASLAGTLGLGKLVAIYDDNGISIDGEVDGWFTEDVGSRFEAYGWTVVRDIDGHDPDEIERALASVGNDARPTLLMMKTVIGFGAPNKQGTSSAHGSALGTDEIVATRGQLNWGYDPFVVPESIAAEWNQAERGRTLEAAWNDLFSAYQAAYPAQAAELERRMTGGLPAGWRNALRAVAAEAQATPAPLETRKSSQLCLDALGPAIPELIGGSADLTGSNNTRWAGAEDIQDGGRYVNYGVREFGMTAVANGLALHGGIIPFTGTFLVFMEYARNAVRLASLMGVKNIFVYTHDSVALGEDGPTHQPIEQMANLRDTPNLETWRPCDTVETAVAWETALERDGPSAIILSRQKIMGQQRSGDVHAIVARGGYVLRGAEDPAAILIATGSEVDLAMAANEALSAEGIATTVVSMPCMERFLAQDADYRASVIPPGVRARVAVEAGATSPWYRFVGLDGEVVGIDRFGLSAPGDQAMTELGMTAEAVIAATKRVVAR